MTRMDDNDDAQKLAELGQALPALDLDTTSAARMAHRVRQDLGRGPPRRRLVLPIAAAIVTGSYATWTILKLCELLG